MRKKLLIAFVCFYSAIHAHTTDAEGPLQPLTGNFSVPSATQVSPLVSFGQLLVGKNVLVPELSGYYTSYHHGYLNVIEPNFIYGILDTLSLTLFIPFTPQSKSYSSTSTGIEDMTAQLEFAYYTKNAPNYSLQGTVVGFIQFPTGSSSADPATGAGSFSYFLGTTFSFLSPNWYAFVSPGISFTAFHHGRNVGNAYLYEWGFARVLPFLSPKGWVFNLECEFDGVYSTSHKSDPDSGGNTILLTPSICLSSQRTLLQFGVSFPIVESLNGHQDKLRYIINYNLGVSLQF